MSDQGAGPPAARVGSPAASSPAVGGPAAGHPTPGDPTPGGPTADDPTPGGPTAGGPTPGDPTAGDVLRRAVGTGQIPGAVFAAGGPGRPPEVVVTGDAQVTGGPRRAMHRDTLFDLASLTKVVATLPAVLRLADRGELALDDPASRFLPGFRGGGRESVTVRQLLAHTSGLPAELPFWRTCRDPADARRALLTATLLHPPGRHVAYSDLGFMLLGHIVAAIAGAPLDAAVAELVTGPLAMTRTRFVPNAASGGAAATEPQPDGTALTAVVHDENARFGGGVAGHAGLFAPVDDLVRYLELAWLGGDYLSPAARLEAGRLQTGGLGGRRGLGWVLRGDPADFLGGRWPASSLSHTGFTGTSLACDPASGHWAVLLTNDVHFGRNRNLIRPLRESVHAACAPAPPPGAPAGPAPLPGTHLPLSR